MSSRVADAIIFDLDGTLWDTSSACATGWNNVLRRNQISFREIHANDVRSVAGQPHAECIRQVFQGIPDKLIQILTQETSEEDSRMVRERGGELYPGVKSGLNLLAAQYPLYIVSNCQKGYIETFFEYTELSSLFKDFECWGNTGLEKAENLQNLIQRNRLLSPVYVGDTQGDSLAARQSAIPFVHAKYGFGKCDDFDLAVNSFAELLKHFL